MMDFQNRFYRYNLERENNNKLKILLLFLNPFAAYVWSLFTMKDKWSLRVIYVFFILFGFSMVVKLSNPDDCSRYLEEWLFFRNDPKGSLRDIWMDYTSGSDYRTVKDLYVYLLYYICSIIDPSNYHWLWGINAMIFAYFYVKSLAYLTRLDSFRQTFVVIMLVFIFMFSNPIYNINSIRFWTGSWIVVYATFKILIDKKYGYFLLIFLASFVHTTFMLFLAIFLLAFLFRKIGMGFVWILFVASFVFSEISLTLLGDVQQYLPNFLQNMVWSYTESEGALRRISGNTGLPAYAVFLNALPRYYEVILIIVMLGSSKNFSDGSKIELKCIVLYYSLVNFISIIPSCARFYYAAIPLLVYVWLSNHEILRKYNWIICFAPLAYSYRILYWCRKMALVLDPGLLVFPLPVTLIKYIVASL